MIRVGSKATVSGPGPPLNVVGQLSEIASK